MYENIIIKAMLLFLKRAISTFEIPISDSTPFTFRMKDAYK